jgi:hypothetical protein
MSPATNSAFSTGPLHGGSGSFNLTDSCGRCEPSRRPRPLTRGVSLSVLDGHGSTVSHRPSDEPCSVQKIRFRALATSPQRRGANPRQTHSRARRTRNLPARRLFSTLVTGTMAGLHSSSHGATLLSATWRYGGCCSSRSCAFGRTSSKNWKSSCSRSSRPTGLELELTRSRSSPEIVGFACPKIARFQLSSEGNSRDPQRLHCANAIIVAGSL